MAAAIEKCFGSDKADIIVDSAATPFVFKSIMDAARKASIVVLSGNYKEPVQLDVTQIQRREITVLGHMMYIRQEFAEGLSIGIIMDGNGRWAKQRGLPRTAGHKKGAAVFQDIANYCEELGVSSVTFYAFSTENWKRPLEEVSAIMKLFGEYLLKGFNYKDRNIRIKFLGDRAALDAKLQKLMNELEEDSAAKTGMTLNIAVNYGGRPEIVRAARQLAQQVAEGTLKPEDITEEMMSDHMYTAGQKDPDFILRPSGEKRLSNFMLWQAAYAELVEMDVLWPDFTRDDLDAAITEFNKRSRRFGGI